MDPTVAAALLTGIPLGGAGLIAYGRLQERTNTMHMKLDEKASKEIVEANYNEIINRLDRIETKLTKE